jgi:hypothetical protein
LRRLLTRKARPRAARPAPTAVRRRMPYIATIPLADPIKKHAEGDKFM